MLFCHWRFCKNALRDSWALHSIYVYHTSRLLSVIIKCCYRDKINGPLQPLVHRYVLHTIFNAMGIMPTNLRV